MSVMARIATAFLTAVMVFSTSTVYGVAGPDNPVSGLLQSPTFGSRFGIGGDKIDWFFISTYGNSCDGFSLNSRQFGGTGGAGPMGMAFGFGRRDVLGFDAGEQTIGDYDVTEFFGEIDLPILSGVRGAESLGLHWRGDPSKDGLDYQREPQSYKVLPVNPGMGWLEWPGALGDFSDFGAQADPLMGLFDSNGHARIDFSQFGSMQDVYEEAFVGIGFDGDLFPGPNLVPGWEDFVTFGDDTIEQIGVEFGLTDDLKLRSSLNQEVVISGTTYGSVFSGSGQQSYIVEASATGDTGILSNSCRDPQLPTDPNFLRTARHGGGSWGQAEDDQWAIKRVGYTDDEYSAWNQVPETAVPTIVAVVDTGLDWHHLDISPDNIWRNEDEDPDNGIDDDNNGYVDDVIGWDFIAKNNRPWDFDGHGTIVAGIIAATQGNGAGIAGINPHARIMVLKGLGNFGSTRASFIAEAIMYAVDNGAQVINLSVGGPHTNRMEQAAIEFARQAGVLVVVAAGNEGIELGDYGPGGADGALTVGATHVDNRAAAFSNFGERVDIAAPGVDVLSLRARFTDANYRPGIIDPEEYSLGDSYVGEDKRYIHASGTSFSAPIVAGTASLIMSKNPGLTADQVRELLLQTATDVEAPGKDDYSGYGMLNARAALSVDSDFSVTAEITGVELTQVGQLELIRVVGTIDASDFKRAWMQIGAGENPGGWKFVGQKRKYPIQNGTLGTIPVSDFYGADLWQVVINVEHENGVVKRARYPFKIK